MAEDIRRLIAKRAVKELKAGNVVNLGVGIPVLVADYIDDESIFLQSENGILGVGPSPNEKQIDPFIINAARKPASVVPGASFCDSAASFGMIRGGHLDVTIIGAMQVSQYGDLANWDLPGSDLLGMGGAMDLVVGAKKVIILMQHTSPTGQPKILPKCTIPLTAAAAVDLLITEFAVFSFENKRMILTEINSEITLEKIKQITPAEYVVSQQLKQIKF